jgi:ABC-type sugar transport system substrate-binding protein
LVDYLELARRARRKESDPKAVTNTQETDPEARRLLAAGFEPKERGGMIIWQRPDTGFWVSREMALHLLRNHAKEDSNS